MNKDTLHGQWKQLTGRVKETWGELTDNEGMRIRGTSERLAGMNQQRYGATRQHAIQQVRRFMRDHSSSK
jgi:uncharacterized protein YjbJ (UPF0337 family)